jgi:hypothetical protein
MFRFFVEGCGETESWKNDAILQVYIQEVGTVLFLQKDCRELPHIQRKSVKTLSVCFCNPFGLFCKYIKVLHVNSVEYLSY